jgi:hypothetical protein
MVGAQIALPLARSGLRSVMEELCLAEHTR